MKVNQTVKVVKWLIAGVLVVFLVYWCIWVIDQRKMIVYDSLCKDIRSNTIRVGMTVEQVAYAWNCRLSLCYVGSDGRSVYEGWTDYPYYGSCRLVFYNDKLKEWYVIPYKK